MHRLSVAALCVWDVVKGCLSLARSRWKLSGAQSPRPGDAGPEPARNERAQPWTALPCTMLHWHNNILEAISGSSDVTRVVQWV